MKRFSLRGRLEPLKAAEIPAVFGSLQFGDKFKMSPSATNVWTKVTDEIALLVGGSTHGTHVTVDAGVPVFDVVSHAADPRGRMTCRFEDLGVGDEFYPLDRLGRRRNLYLRKINRCTALVVPTRPDGVLVNVPVMPESRVELIKPADLD